MEKITAKLELTANGSDGFRTRSFVEYDNLTKSDFRAIERAILKALTDLGVEKEK